MASFPIPTLNIPGSITSPQVDSPQEAYAKSLTLGNLMQQRQARQQQMQLGNIQLQQAQIGLRDTQAMSAAMQQWDGKDPGDLFDLARKNGASANKLFELQNSVLDHKAKIASTDKTTIENAMNRNKQLQSRLTPVAGIADPAQQKAAYDAALDEAVSAGEISAAEKTKHAYQGPEQVRGFMQGLNYENWALGQKNAADADSASTNAAAKARETGLKEFSGIVDPQSGLADPAQYAQFRATHPALNMPAIQSGAWNAATFRSDVPEDKRPEYDAFQRMKAMKPEEWAARVDQVIPPNNITIGGKTSDTSALNQRTKALVTGYIQRGDFKGADLAIKDASDQLGRTETGVRTAQATAPIKVNVIAGEQAARNDANLSAFTNDDWQRMGETYARYGEMASLGQNSTAAKARIINEANNWARARGLSPADLEMMHAAAKGDKASLNKFVAQRDQIASFEQTAQKNLDLFIDAAKNIPDTGVPWLNTPLRLLDAKLVGSANMAAVNAAREVANNEIAKVTSGGGLSGVLSDAARHEVQTYNPQNATLAQTLAVARILKADMANRHSSMDSAVTGIKERIGQGAASGAAAGPKATKRYNPKTMQIEDIPQ